MKNNSGLKLRFGILRPMGDFKGLIKDSNIKYEDLWKHDEYIHHLPPLPDPIPNPPTKPQKNFLMSNSAYAEAITQYEKDVDTYNKYLKISSLHEEIENIKKEQDYTCVFCGFKDLKYLEIHHIDGNHFNNNKENLVAACTLCHRQHHLLWLSIYDHATLGVAQMSYLPQTELNHLQRISIVFKDDPKYSKLLGSNGKLGSMIGAISNNFSRPLHSFMIPEKQQIHERELYRNQHKILSPNNTTQAHYKQLELALENIGKLKPSEAERAAIDVYDNFIGLSHLKQLSPNMTEDDIRLGQKQTVREELIRFDKAYEKEFEDKFNNSLTNFSIFELAMALKTIDYENYKEFNPPCMYLIFKENIFTKEQIEYYKKLDYFNVENWGYGAD